MRKTRWFRLALVLTFLLNVAGSPMAWAQWLGADQPVSAEADMTPHCHGQASHGDAPAAPDSAPDSMPCCEGGLCGCAAPALLVVHLIPGTPFVPPPAPAPASLPALPPQPLDDTLRPPIH